MAGLIFLMILLLYVFVLMALGTAFLSRLPISSSWQKILLLVLVAFAFPLPLADEVIGKRQFEALCKINGIQGADLSRAQGKRVRMRFSDYEPLVAGVILPTKQSDITYRDAETGATLVHYKDYRSAGGWLMRAGLGMGSGRPLLFEANGCDRRRERELLQQNAIVVVN